MQHHELVALAGVLERSAVGGLDAHPLARAARAGRPLTRPGPDVDLFATPDGVDHQVFDT
jgi:hypothetical protein